MAAGRVYLHGADAQASVDDKLAEGCGAFVAVATVDHQQTAQMFELSHREVGCQRGLLSFLANTKTQKAVRTRRNLSNSGFQADRKVELNISHPSTLKGSTGG